MNKRGRAAFEILFRVGAPAAASVLIFAITLFAYMIPAFEENMKARKREMIRELTNSAWSMLAVLDQKVARGELSVEQARAEALERVAGLRYGPEMKDYFWINDMQPRLLAHPYSSDLIGRDVSDYADPAGKKLFLEFVRVVRERGEGFVDYQWQWKDDREHIVPKLSYVRGFAPWGWIVGTGIYVEDVREEIAALTRRMSAVCATFLVLMTALLSYVTWIGARAEHRRLRAEMKVRVRGDELARLGRVSLLNELASGLAHELNQPLCVMLGGSELSLRMIAEGRGNEPETIEALREVAAQAERAGEIIRRMRNFSSRGELEREARPIQDLIREAAALLDAQARRWSIDVRLEFGRINPDVFVDYIQIEQAFINLAKNAFDAMNEIDQNERILTIRLRQPSNQEVAIDFEDTGPGVSADNMARLFAPFFTTKPEGIGIGLSLSRSIVEAHDGRLSVTRGSVRGMVFTITLPVYRKTT